MSGDAGEWKRSQNEIVEVFPDGRRVVRFRPLPPAAVPRAMTELCLAYRHSLDQQQVTPLLAIACLVLHLLCIHPFRDGNGRVSRLATLLTLFVLPAISQLLLHRPRKKHVGGEYAGEDVFGREPEAEPA